MTRLFTIQAIWILADYRVAPLDWRPHQLKGLSRQWLPLNPMRTK